MHNTDCHDCHDATQTSYLRPIMCKNVFICKNYSLPFSMKVMSLAGNEVKNIIYIIL